MKSNFDETKVLHHALNRIATIDAEILKLNEEQHLMRALASMLKHMVCPRCLGEGSIMLLVEGCECDGPRQHECPDCRGTGNPRSKASKLAGF